jgi:polar amino acid transport system substrate-binding protein
MGMAGMTVTEERLQSVNFSTTYATGVQVVIVAEDSPIKSLDDLKADGTMKYGVQQDTTGDIYASDTVENGGYGSDNVIRYKTGAEAVQALKSGKVSAVIIDNEPAKSFVAANEGLRILDAEWAVEDYAICIAKENADLLTKINTALAELEAEGKIKAIIDKYIAA